MTRRVSWVILCEDEQHYAFAKRFLDQLTRPELREQRKQVAGGHSQVRARFRTELAAARKQGGRAALLVIVDADGQSIEARRRYVQDLCPADEQPGPDDAVAIVVPERNIETWIRWLDGHPVDATTRYPKLGKERLCKPAVDALKQRCDAGQLGADAPRSLQDACEEFSRVIQKLRS